jgi:hypothetical protein
MLNRIAGKFITIGASLCLCACASQKPAVCGNAAFGFQASTKSPVIKNPDYPSATLRLMSVRQDGTAVFKFEQNGKRITLQPNKPYYNSNITPITITLTSADPVAKTVRITEQLVPLAD